MPAPKSGRTGPQPPPPPVRAPDSAQGRPAAEKPGKTPPSAARLPLTSEGAAAQARAKRLAAEIAPPPHAAPSVWADPLDTVRTRTPQQVRGYRRGDILGHLHRRGTDVTRDHVLAGHHFRAHWDIAMLGLTSVSPLLALTGGGAPSPAPVTGPPASATARAECERDVERVLRSVGYAAVPLLLWVVVENRDVQSWCDAAAARGEARPDRKKVFGRLLAVLDRLAEHYGYDERAERLRQIRAEMGG